MPLLYLVRNKDDRDDVREIPFLTFDHEIEYRVQHDANYDPAHVTTLTVYASVPVPQIMQLYLNALKKPQSFRSDEEALSAFNKRYDTISTEQLPDFFV